MLLLATAIMAMLAPRTSARLGDIMEIAGVKWRSSEE
jgi:hypothetical protein